MNQDNNETRKLKSKRNHQTTTNKNISFFRLRSESDCFRKQTLFLSGHPCNMYDPTNHRVQNGPETDGVCKILELAFRGWRCARFFLRAFSHRQLQSQRACLVGVLSGRSSPKLCARRGARPRAPHLLPDFIFLLGGEHAHRRLCGRLRTPACQRWRTRRLLLPRD